MKEKQLSADEEFCQEIAKQLPIKAAYKDVVRLPLANRRVGRGHFEGAKAGAFSQFNYWPWRKIDFRRFVRDAVDRVPVESRVTRRCKL